MAMVTATADSTSYRERDVLVPRLEEKHEDAPEKKQVKKTIEEKQEEEDVPYRKKIGLPLDDELFSDDDDDNDDLQCFLGEASKMTHAELALYCQQVDESGTNMSVAIWNSYELSLGILKVRNPRIRKKSSSTEPKAKKAKTDKKSKDPNALKRPQTTFFLFMDDFRKTYKEENPDSKCGKEEKKPYMDKAAELKAEYGKAKLVANNAEEDEDGCGSSLKKRCLVLLTRVRMATNGKLLAAAKAKAALHGHAVKARARSQCQGSPHGHAAKAKARRQGQGP
ncbi:hypothetical protein SO802_021318 [Lithocarpus litseifolius]|uniref:HMG box domain-containing protein n=1 Tax=Lithocarpus litseifolius TaxID=425828 RepID=A0AAW2CGZ7_9ROSI